jgi:hypothetical protein
VPRQLFAANKINFTTMRPLRKSLLFALLAFLFPVLTFAAASPFEGRWRLDKTRSTALDGWSEWDLVIQLDGNHVTLGYDMQWHTTQFSTTNVLDSTQAVTLPNFFRVEQRHMALYPAKGQTTSVRTSWLDDKRTLRVEADAPIEISQGQALMRIYAEYRLVEGDRELLLIELHSSRPRPLIYRFTKVSTEK